MGHVPVALFILGMGFASSAQTTLPSPLKNGIAPRLATRSLLQEPVNVPTQPLRLLPSGSRDIISATCPDDALGVAANAGVVVNCGYVPVPFDRTHPNAGDLPIYFEQYLHSGTGPAESAIMVVNETGRSGTALRDIFVPNLTPDFDLHDVLLIDNRGSGQSGAILCPDMQYGTGSVIDELVDCAAQLGETASLYGSGDMAKDMEAVRAALGYNVLDLYGLSGGAPPLLAYASRFADHIRSIVLDSPAGADFRHFALVESKKANSEPRVVGLDCQRSPICSLDHPNPHAELKELIRTLRAHPVKGYGYTASGQQVHVRIDEAVLLNFLLDNPTGNFTDTGELLAAGRSLANGDPVPLLRLGAEGIYPLQQNYGDPTVFSVGGLVDTSCVDVHMPWNWHVPMPVRFAEFADAVEDLPDDYFAPFSKAAAMTLEFDLATNCVWWQKPRASAPVLPSHPTFPNVPVFVLSGDLDNIMPLEETSLVAGLFPSATLVSFAELGHVAVYWSQCAIDLTARFIETPDLTDFSCAKTPPTVWAALGRFPILAKDARPAQIDPSGANQIGEPERKVVTVAVAAATDAMQRSFLNLSLGLPVAGGVGLRGGTFSTDYTNFSLWVTTLTNCSFAQDVLVSGIVSWGFFAPPFTADLTVSGPGTVGGTLHVDGVWQTPGPVGSFAVSGMLGGRNVAVLVPEQ